MHVAAGCGLSTIGLFENSPFKRAHWYPWQVPHEVVPSPTFAVADIESQAMVAAVVRLLPASRA